MADCLISFGSNQGDGLAAFSQVRAACEAQTALQALRYSRPHTTLPIGCSGFQATYLNAALRFTTDWEPHDLIAWLLDLEKRLGRIRNERWGPRAVDLDLLLYDRQRIQQNGPGQNDLVVPHPRMSFRRFVLLPAVEIAADMLHPIARMSLGALLNHLSSASPQIAVLGTEELSELTIRTVVQRHAFPSDESRRESKRLAFSCAIGSRSALNEARAGENHYWLLPIRAEKEWQHLHAAPRLLVYWKRDLNGPANRWMRQIVDEIFAGPRLEIETAVAVSAVAEIEAALAAMLPSSIVD